MLCKHTHFLGKNKKCSFKKFCKTINSISDEAVPTSGAPSDAVGWGGWAWSTVSSILPVDWDNDWSQEQQIAYSGHTVHLGIYVDDATITFKVLHLSPSISTFLFSQISPIFYSTVCRPWKALRNKCSTNREKSGTNRTSHSYLCASPESSWTRFSKAFARPVFKWDVVA